MVKLKIPTPRTGSAIRMINLNVLMCSTEITSDISEDNGKEEHGI